MKLYLTDLTGRIVTVLADQQAAAGKYTVKVDAVPLQPGVYAATLILDTDDGDMIKTIKLVRQR